MKIGDKLICKEDFSYSKGKFYFSFKKGIDYLVTSAYYVSSENYSYVQFFGDSYGAYCNLREETCEKYFYTKREVRKLKLEKLNLC